MALINCPECNKEVSEKAEVCIHCGCPLLAKESNTIESVLKDIKCTEDTYLEKKNSKIPLFFIIGGVAILVIIVLGIFVLIPIYKYNKALDALNSGEYELAYESFSKLGNYKDSEELCIDAKYETYVFSCIEDFNNYLKNPDTLCIKEVVLYQGIRESVDDKSKVAIVLKEMTVERPIIVMRITAQNGFGGNTISYVTFLYDSNLKNFFYYGSCDTLDMNEVNEDELIYCTLINSCNDNLDMFDNINVERINSIIKDNTYTNVKIIE